ncbi:P-loop containing nucleoside triphosphate hydrolase protein [Gaertneriomyces semiglobifer]|nr:P-loop containing nucleoside triphosphate hydrolase protein [Gaertneriomyces semiglobifer]
MASSALERVRPDLGTDAIAQQTWAQQKWVWISDKEEGYLAGTIASENGESVEINLLNGTKRSVNINDTEKMNPPKFDKAEDMADLTYLNEASVVHNLKLRYLSNLIYTYSGLFLVAVNPYKRLPIYTDDIIKAYKGRKRSEMPPHIYAISDAAYHDMLQDKEDQSILITGESGAGKTENTKKVIQYLASIASANGGGKNLGTLEQQILQANPILESFGNAQTIRNNNSSRFGKFIRIEFTATGHIAGANIDWYLLEKSRVTHQTSKERNYHIFYQLLKGADEAVKARLLLDGSLNDYRFTKNSNKNIDGVDDAAEFKLLQESMDIMQISKDEQQDLLKAIAAILHLGNITFTANREDQAQLADDAAQSVCEKVCHVLGIPVSQFVTSLLKPKIKAGRDWVTQARNVDQVLYSIEALARSLYERMFGKLVERINDAIFTHASKATFIGVLDIAGFEIFENNSFEQLCINYTNEKLQQFFNHHMFILEQEEYRKEGIEWKFIDFGLDLQPTIDLIEKTSPIGVLSCLDEECVMPKATDKTFIEKLHGIWKGKSSKYEVPRFNQGFLLQHYAGQVEYNTTGWLDKNKDPLNENVTRLLATSTDKYIASLFSEYLTEAEDNVKTRGITKKGAFRTVAQRHKEQLNSLMTQLYSTEPHFVRCIIPNEEKKAAKLSVPLVLEQLRCNGVLEGIRICRAGFPNRLPFQDFRQRYDLLAPGVIPRGFMDGRQAAQLLLQHLALDANQFRVGSSKVFFRAGSVAISSLPRSFSRSKR